MHDSPYELPPLYATWLADLLPPGGLPRERRATCDDCAMCTKADGTLPTAGATFRPDVKCCVFVPRLASFLVGRILRDDDPSPVAVEGRASVERRLAARVGVGPLGLDRPPGQDLVHRHAAGAFGQALGLRCPHYVDQGGGRCGIWRHREATCTTWFCQFVRGREGFEAWHAVRALLQVVEREVARWCALEAGIDAEVLAALLPGGPDDAAPPAGAPWEQLVDGRVDDRSWRWAWGPWAGREREFFLEAARRADGLAWPDVLALGGTELRARAEVVRRAASRHVRPATPTRLAAGRFQVVATRADGGLRVVTHSTFDAIDLPAPLLPLLARFDGRRTGEVLAELKQACNAELAPDFLRQLVDWGVLVPATGGGPAAGRG